ncbi:conserved hypothetical protein [Gloeothece citriformis PCC 7424]|uniref:Uncharacterized protein n=1 Tax=Gloeothece citriformis (strain PCC 7424) TaxID=65393 RepID=B7KH42_GLOC7|nr:hypothetical protein [Gloeothece citriformis]ACK69251.1 conserved hypothetical protein [Gloeothece citriformis PCC 7424]
MKFKVRSLAIAISLSILFWFTGLIFTAQGINILNQPKAYAQDVEVKVLCNLPQEIAITFLNSECQEITLTEPTVYYRYYSGDNNRYGRYLTSERYERNIDIISKLALNQAWGNGATKMLLVTLPAGTVVYEGIVAPQNPDTCYPGGGKQTFIIDSRVPEIIWAEGTPINVEDFLCQ